MPAFDLTKWGPATVMIVAIVLIAAGGGLAVVIINPDTLTFQQYLDDLKAFAFAVAGFAGAKALLESAKQVSGNVDDDGPGDGDGLPHIKSSTPSEVPEDLGD